MKTQRRDILKVGALGGWMSLDRMLRLQAAEGKQNEQRSAILVFLGGGPSHQDTFDMKPEAPAEYRGQFQPISTSTPGIQICEHLPLLAKRSHQYSIVRGISHRLADHGLGTRYLMTGNLPTPVIQYPMYGSVVSKEMPGRDDLPSFVSIDRPVEGPGYLGSEYGPMSTGEKPRFGQPFRVRGMTLDGTVTLEHFKKMHHLRRDLDLAFSEFENVDDQVRGFDRFSERAYRIISSPAAREAFDLTQESNTETERFGQHEFGQSAILATRLIEAGVRFVTVLLEGWDTHRDNFNTLGRELLPRLDQCLSAMFDRLEAKGLLQSTSILVTGEFGRTPKVNGNAGRDHWSRAMSSLLAGGGISGGRVVGETDKHAAEPSGEGFSPDDLAATFLSSIGISPKTEYQADVGRPITLIRDGQPIREILS